jgi:Protein of unknown function (DUF1579)
MQGMPKPTEGHQKLSRLVGNWIGDETLEPSPWGPGGKAIGKMNATTILDGFFVEGDYVEEKDGQVVFRGHSVFGWDAKASNVVWYWFDSMGNPPLTPSRGTWDGDTLILRSKQDQGEGRYTYRFEGKDRYFFRLENSFDGGKTWVKFMEGNYRRA